MYKCSLYLGSGRYPRRNVTVGVTRHERRQHDEARTAASAAAGAAARYP